MEGEIRVGGRSHAGMFKEEGCDRNVLKKWGTRLLRAREQS